MIPHKHSLRMILPVHRQRLRRMACQGEWENGMRGGVGTMMSYGLPVWLGGIRKLNYVMVPYRTVQGASDAEERLQFNYALLHPGSQSA